MNSIKDILRDSYVEMGLVENISLPYLLLVLGTAFVCAMIIYLVYKFFYRGAVYSENFGLLIIMSAAPHPRSRTLLPKHRRYGNPQRWRN